MIPNINNNNKLYIYIHIITYLSIYIIYTITYLYWHFMCAHSGAPNPASCPPRPPPTLWRSYPWAPGWWHPKHQPSGPMAAVRCVAKIRCATAAPLHTAPCHRGCSGQPSTWAQVMQARTWNNNMWKLMIWGYIVHTVPPLWEIAISLVLRTEEGHLLSDRKTPWDNSWFVPLSFPTSAAMQLCCQQFAGWLTNRKPQTCDTGSLKFLYLQVQPHCRASASRSCRCSCIHRLVSEFILGALLCSWNYRR